LQPESDEFKSCRLFHMDFFPPLGWLLPWILACRNELFNAWSYSGDEYLWAQFAQVRDHRLPYCVRTIHRELNNNSIVMPFAVITRAVRHVERNWEQVKLTHNNHVIFAALAKVEEALQAALSLSKLEYKIHTHIYVHIYINTYIYAYINTHTYNTYIHTHTHTHIYIYNYIHTYTYTNKNKHTYIHVWLQTN
jgi:hypothetical protein